VASPKVSQSALPLQVAAVCYRRNGQLIEFLLVNTNGGGKWTFPKGDPEPAMSHRQAAEREAWEEAGVRGHIESRHFHLYLHSKGVFWKPPGVREFVIKWKWNTPKRRMNPSAIPRGLPLRKRRRPWPKGAK